MPVAPLYRAVAETARAAAFEDSRFLPVTKEEAPQLEISLSVLSRLFPIQPEAVEVGRHGLVISQGVRRGLLLPQVPVEHGWDRKTFLAANLPQSRPAARMHGARSQPSRPSPPKFLTLMCDVIEIVLKPRFAFTLRPTLSNLSSQEEVS